MNQSYSTWEEEIINKQNLSLNTVGTLIKLQNIKEETYLDYYYGDIALVILKRNLNQDLSLEEIKDIVNNKANYSKLFNNKKLSVDILTDEDIMRLNFDIVHYIKAILVSKSNNNKLIDEINKLTKGDYSSLIDLHQNFYIIKKYLNINLSSFNEERAKLDKYYNERMQEIENDDEYHRLIAKEWKDSLISN